MQIHATLSRFMDKGILFVGPSGAGKSTAALLLIDAGGMLVADDQVIIDDTGDVLVGSCPETIKGKMEVRGVGIVDMPCLKSSSIDLVVELVQSVHDVPRMPDPRLYTIGSKSIQSLALCAFDAAFVAKIKIVLQQM